MDTIEVTGADLTGLEKLYHRKKPLPAFQIGDTVNVHVLIREGEKERPQIFAGTVIKIKGGGKNLRSTFTVRRIVAGEGVERTFPFHSPVVQHIEVTRPGKARRAKLYYLRDRVGKATKVKERRVEQKAKAKSKTKSRGRARKKTTGSEAATVNA